MSFPSHKAGLCWLEARKVQAAVTALQHMHKMRPTCKKPTDRVTRLQITHAQDRLPHILSEPIVILSVARTVRSIHISRRCCLRTAHGFLVPTQGGLRLHQRLTVWL